MSATLLEAPTNSSQSDISAVLETLLPIASGVTQARSKFQRQLIAAALHVLAEWLTDQARILAEESRRDSVATLTPIRATAHPTAATLTPREQEVAVLIARGLTNSQVARELRPQAAFPEGLGDVERRRLREPVRDREPRAPPEHARQQGPRQHEPEQHALMRAGGQPRGESPGAYQQHSRRDMPWPRPTARRWSW